MRFSGSNAALIEKTLPLLGELTESGRLSWEPLSDRFRCLYESYRIDIFEDHVIRFYRTDQVEGGEGVYIGNYYSSLSADLYSAVWRTVFSTDEYFQGLFDELVAKKKAEDIILDCSDTQTASEVDSHLASAIEALSRLPGGSKWTMPEGGEWTVLGEPKRKGRRYRSWR